MKKKAWCYQEAPPPFSLFFLKRNSIDQLRQSVKEKAWCYQEVIIKLKLILIIYLQIKIAPSFFFLFLNKILKRNSYRSTKQRIGERKSLMLPRDNQQVKINSNHLSID